MNAKAMLLAALAMLGVLGAAAAGLYLTRQAPTVPSKEFRVRRYSEVVREYLKDHDKDGDGRLSQDEFREAYEKAKLDLFHTLDVVAAFNRLDADRDRSITEADARIFEQDEKRQDRLKEKEADAEQGLVEIEIDSVKVKANPHQREWILAELAAFKLQQLPWAGTYFERRYLKRYGRVRLKDGSVLEGFIREGDGSAAALEDKLADGRLFLLTDNRRLTTYDRAAVSDVEYNDEHPRARFMRQVQAARLSDADAQLLLARECLRLGLKDDALTFFRRVLVFQPGNEEAQKALGLRLDGRLFVAVN
ncbi:EF-hand domain-containing protein [bacterium]|nr:MAG: EF-hand domain-containing protein [bacterium]RIK65646.1 MAG: hypothetical protein DCC64_00590 [Planctomycetota bacterium]